MTINIEYETDQELGIDYAALASQVLRWRIVRMTGR